ncbi:9717_t:CDS:2 [Dentiscutata erythropus]|uniref:9717_t:CDS:1 n=1 Tax=Dentiscutata erythropus TaxID=1348616 RepID=A0A9N9GJD6_9GLOM|nr:9717_t:CDS:2 [Dentiscutata erythropus]
MQYYKCESDESSDSSFKWYELAWKAKIPEYKFGVNDSDADNMIDEA